MLAPPLSALDRPALLAALRARAAWRDRLALAAASRSVPLCDAIDAHLTGGGLARAALHEVQATDPGAATGFCALVLARSGGPVVWIGAGPEAWPPGLARFGLSPAELILVQASQPADALWAMEESLRCPGIAGATLVLPVPVPDPAAAPRLHLAAEAGGAIGLLVQADGTATGESPDALERPAPHAERHDALTRWRISALAGTGHGGRDLGDPRWRLELLRCRGGRPEEWQVVWRPAAERLDLVEPEGEDQAALTTPRRQRRR